MKVIVALDDDNGMMFNGRRQSRDAVVREKIAEITYGSRLWMNEYSRKQFQDMEINKEAAEDFLDKAAEGEYCFIEDTGISGVLERVEEFIIFRWNRRYPGDLKFDVIPGENGFACIESGEFEGRSHDKITMEVWRRL